jgi:hypothetical protein
MVLGARRRPGPSGHPGTRGDAVPREASAGRAAGGVGPGHASRCVHWFCGGTERERRKRKNHNPKPRQAPKPQNLKP